MEGITPAPSPFHPTCLFLSFVIIFVILKIFKAGCFISLGVVISLFDRDCFNFLEFMDWKFITTFFHPLNDLTFTWLYILTKPFVNILLFLWINVSLNVHFQEFTGNNDTDTIKYNYFRGTFETRFLKLYPKDYNTRANKCLRVEVYGCKDNAGEWINVWINVCVPNMAATLNAPRIILLLLIKIWTADSTFDFL